MLDPQFISLREQIGRRESWLILIKESTGYIVSEMDSHSIFNHGGSAIYENYKCQAVALCISMIKSFLKIL